jgi:hypothetical protein
MMTGPVMQRRVNGDRIAGAFGIRGCRYRHEVARI